MRILGLLILSLTLCHSVWSQSADSVLIQEGVASFYGQRFDGRMTANGEIFSMDSLTAAHKYLPFDTWVKVIHIDTNQSIWVRINDRLPKTSRRIIELSRMAAKHLGMIDRGIGKVRLEVRTIEEMNALFFHYSGDPPGTLRVRYFDSAIPFDKEKMDFTWN